MANLRLSNAVLGQLARPGFSRNAGLAIGAGMLGVERREREEEQRLVQESTLELMQKAQIAQETGDMGMLTGAANDLNALLSETKNKESRDLLIRSISAVNQQRAATQANKTTNTAMSILNTEKALEQFKDADARRAAGELVEVTPFEERQRRALEERLAMMKQNSAAVVEADNIALATEIKKYEDQDKLYTAKKSAVVRGLSQVAFGSDEYNKLAQTARSQGFGVAVNEYEKVQQDAEKSRLEIEALRRQNKPLSPAQMDELKSVGINIDDPYLAKPIYINMKTKEAEAKVNLALEQILPASDERAVGVAQGALARWANRGNISPLWFDDLAEKIQEMPDEKQLELFNRVNGLAPVQIEQEVIDFLRAEFPNEFKAVEQTEQNVRDEETDKQASINMAIAAINFNKGLEPGDADYLNPADESDRALVWDRIQEERTTKTLETQATATGRFEARPVSLSGNGMQSVDKALTAMGFDR